MMAGLFKDGLASMAPANSAMVMSAGIIAIALRNAGLAGSAHAMSLICAFLWATNMSLMVLRVFVFPRQVWADLANPARSPGFLTLVASTNVFGSCCIVVLDKPNLAAMLLCFGSGLWLVLLSGVMFALFVSDNKLPLEKGVNGAWLLLTVSTQSIVVLGAILTEAAPFPSGVLGMTMLFLVGTALYFMVIPLIIYRLFFKPLSPAELSATFWINAGSMAIICLAGIRLLPILGLCPQLSDLAAPVKALAVGSWALATFWVPCLILLGIWRHVVKRYPFRYGVEYWSIVFPLGMYTVCTQAIHGLYPFWFEALAYLGLMVAVTAWCVVCISFCLCWVTKVRCSIGNRS